MRGGFDANSLGSRSSKVRTENNIIPRRDHKWEPKAWSERPRREEVTALEPLREERKKRGC